MPIVGSRARATVPPGPRVESPTDDVDRAQRPVWRAALTIIARVALALLVILVLLPAAIVAAGP
jgi:hypothetical protein